VSEKTDVLLIGGGEIEELVSTTAAALDLTVVSTSDYAAAREAWEGVGAVCVSQECAKLVASWALPKRQVILLGTDEKELARWSAPLEALVIVLPAGALWLGSVLDESTSRSGTPVIAVLGGSGGVGASTLAAGLALAASRRGASAALVDLDPLSGGLDLLLGLERSQGWRWPSLATAAGYIGDLREYLPKIGKTTVVSMAREEGSQVGADAFTAILHSLKRTHDLVVVDVGRTLGPSEREAVRLATRRLLTVVPTVSGAAAAQRLLLGLSTADVELVVRGSGLSASALTEVLGAKVTARIRDEAGIRSAAARGVPPSSRGFRRVCDSLLGKNVGAK
jgi:secretion/DNA translocation related CpaE-like protein